MKKIFLIIVLVSMSKLIHAATIENNKNLELTPDALGDAVSCRSHDAAIDFASALFLNKKTPSWMHSIENKKSTKGMIGIYGYKLDKQVSFLGQPIENIYFMKNWVITLLPREKVLNYISSQNMKRAPIKFTEQYYKFMDRETGPMLGAFEPTSNSTALMLSKALEATNLPKKNQSDYLFIGCNYTSASEKEFLDLASQSEALMNQVSKDIDKILDEK